MLLLWLSREYFEDVDRTWETFEKTLWGVIGNFYKLSKERFDIFYFSRILNSFLISKYVYCGSYRYLVVWRSCSKILFSSWQCRFRTVILKYRCNIESLQIRLQTYIVIENNCVWYVNMESMWHTLLVYTWCKIVYVIIIRYLLV